MQAVRTKSGLVWKGLRGAGAASRIYSSQLPSRSFHSSSIRWKPADMSLPKSFTIQLAGGKTGEMPAPGYGTWASDGSNPTTPAKPEWIMEPLKYAVDEAGYRHLETAWFYGVDEEIGKAMRQMKVPRSELFISSKIWCNWYHPDVVELACDNILSRMKVDYLDCLLLHWPVAFEPISLDFLRTKAKANNQASFSDKGMKMTEDNSVIIDWKHTSEPIAKAAGKEGSIVPTWNQMKELVKKGKVRAIGVSNFGIKDLEALLPHAQDVPISVNQCEVHPWFPNTELIEWSKKKNILTTCFSPFAGQKADGATLIKDPTVQKLAKKNDMGVGQLLQSWAIERGTVPLGKSGNPERIKANFSVRRLSDEDMKALDDLEIPNGKGRTIDFTEEWGVKLYQN